MKIILAVSLKRDLTGPERLRVFFERAGGGLIKLGQILALRQDFISPLYASELLKLLSRVPETPFIEMHKVFIRETGEPVGKFFAEFNATPVASASIAQVYKARLKDRTMVAVKIQRPGTREVFEADFLIISFFAGLIDFFRLFTSITAAEVAADFISWTRRELDFRCESKNAVAFFEYGRGSNQTVIPVQYPEMTTSKVLIQEFIENGILVEDVILGKIQKDELLKKNIDLRFMSHYLIKDAMRQYFIDGFFHADSHPANLILLPDNKLAFIDFGIVGEAKETRLLLLKFIYGVAAKDIDYMSRYLMEFGRKAFEGEIELYLRANIMKRGAISRVFDKIRDIILEDFKKEVEGLMNPWIKAVASKEAAFLDKSSAMVFFKLIRKAEKYGVHFPQEIILFFRGLAIDDMVALQMSPDFNIIEAIYSFFKEYPMETVEELIKNETNRKELGEKIASVTDDWEEFVEISAAHKEKMLAARERVMELVAYYAEKYPEIMSLIKNL